MYFPNYQSITSRFKLNLLIKILVLIFLSIIFNGCLRTYYPAVAGTRSSAIYLVQQKYYRKHITFLGVEGGTGIVNHDNEINMYGRIQYGRSFAESFYNFNISLFGFGGIYKVDGVEGYNGYKNFLGAGPQIKFGIHINFWEYVKLGLGASFTGGIEFGSFDSFRKEASENHLISTDSKFLFTYVSLFPYLSFKVSNNSSITLQPVIGFPGFISPNIIYNYGAKSFWISYLPSKNNNFYPLGSLVMGFYLPLNL